MTTFLCLHIIIPPHHVTYSIIHTLPEGTDSCVYILKTVFVFLLLTDTELTWFPL